MDRIKPFLLLLCILASFVATGQKLVLETDLTTNRFMVGENVSLTLTIEDIGKDVVVVPGKFELNTSNQFIYTFSITPTKKGELILGPYSIDFNGKKLRSNTLELKIRSQLKENDVRITCVNKASPNEEVIIELVGTKESLAKVKLIDSLNFFGHSSGSSSSTKVVDGVKTSKYMVKFKLTFRQLGIYEIDKTWFDGIPEYLNVRSEKIKIK